MVNMRNPILLRCIILQVSDMSRSLTHAARDRNEDIKRELTNKSSGGNQ
jgi:hypothetical protein